MVKNFFITGEKGSGKSFLLTRLEQNLGLQPSGFKTLPYVIENQVKGHYFHSLVPVNGVENNLPFTIRNQKTSCIAIDDIFNQLGAPCLLESINSQSKVIVMDEIGVWESRCNQFMQVLNMVLNGEKVVLAVLKKADADHLNKIKQRDDSFVVDLDKIYSEEAFKILKTKLQEALK